MGLKMKDVKKTDFLVRLDNKTTSMDTIDLVNEALWRAKTNLMFVLFKSDNPEGGESMNYALTSDILQSNNDDMMES